MAHSGSVLGVLVQFLDVGAVPVPEFDLRQLLFGAHVHVGEDEGIGVDFVDASFQGELVLGDGASLAGPGGGDLACGHAGAPGDNVFVFGPVAGQVVDDHYG